MCVVCLCFGHAIQLAGSCLICKIRKALQTYKTENQAQGRQRLDMNFVRNYANFLALKVQGKTKIW